jgi:tetratricopeptide (TPR) repeat protein
MWSAARAAAVLVLLARVAAGEDTVILKSEPGAAPRAARGTVVDFTGRELVLQTPTGRERRIPAAQVERVETERSADERAGDAAFARGDFRQALADYRAALTEKREPREWVRREILAQLVWCYRNLDQPDQAGEYFLVLLASDPYTRAFDCLPLAWTADAPPPAMKDQARSWLNSKNPAAELIGASQLLATADRAVAADHLKRLAGDPDKRIVWLATAQLWRLERPPADRLRAWNAAIEASEPALRAGAYYVLGAALADAQPEQAALALLKLPILYERERQLAAAALLAAGDCLEKLGRGVQAAGLYRELAGRFPQAPEAAQARRRLERLATSEAARDN